jgi:protein-tyrosine phosphatase
LVQGISVAVHCRQSVGRAGMVAAALLILNSAGTADSVRGVTLARGIQVPETPEQLAWLLQMEERVPAIR